MPRDDVKINGCSNSYNNDNKQTKREWKLVTHSTTQQPERLYPESVISLQSCIITTTDFTLLLCQIVSISVERDLFVNWDFGLKPRLEYKNRKEVIW